MRTFPSLIRLALLLALFIPFCSNTARAQSVNIPARITQSVDTQQTVTLRGNTHPLARSEYDRGAVSDAMPIGRVLLLLQRSPDQEQALQQLLEQQQSKSSPNYHAWLTPEQFGQQFGAADADIQVITQWLASQGFSQINAGPGRTVIEFSGNAGQVRSAFHTEIHRFVMNGEEHTANVADPQIPAALAPVVAGVVSLHDFPKRSHAKVVGEFRRKIGEPGLQPLLTFPNPFGSGNFYGLGPGDFATIYNTKPLLTAGNNGTGQTIAIVGETNLNVQDVQQFRSMFGLSANFDATNIVVNGPDPGITSTDEETEADLDVQWSGAVAPGATIKFVVSASTPASAGIDLSALYIVEHNFAAVMSESYGACENVLGSAGNAFYSTLWQQAAAQGITVIVSSGDGGSAGCDDFTKPQPATHGLAVSGLASTPYNVSVGGTDFDQVNNWAAYWSAANNATGTSAKSYIPEIPWSQSCAQIGLTGCGSSAPQGSVNIVAGSGGPSAIYPKPKWQLGVAGMPNDSHRNQPDVSLFAGVGFNGTGYVLCQLDRIGPCYVNSGSVSVELVGGTSASAPAFAGIIALVNQKQSNTSNPAPRQGNANNVLYALANKSGASCTSSPAEAANCVFNDVTKGSSLLPTGKPGVGTNSVPCQGGSPDCSTSVAGGNGVLVDPAHTTTEAWTATAGYDMTTGLGSVNVTNLATAWGTASSVGTTTTLSLSPTTGIKHGSAENVAVNVTVKANTGTGTPTGDVSLIASFVGPPATIQGLDHFTLSSTGAVTNATTESLPGGTYNVTAHYAGDGLNAPSDSTPVQVTVGQESSQTFIVVPTFDSNGGKLTNPNATSFVYGTPYSLQMYVTNAQAAVSPTGTPSPLCAQVNQLTCPTGTVSLTSNGAAADRGSFALNNAGYAQDTAPVLTGGTYSLVAQYLGDGSYQPSSSAPHTLTITPAPTSQQWANFPTFAVVGQPFPLGVAVGTGVAGVSPTGTVTFYDGTTPLPGTVTYMATGQGSNVVLYASTSTTIPTGGSHTVTAQYTGDASYGPSTSSPQTFVVKYPTSISQSESATTIAYGQNITVTAVITGNSRGPGLVGQVQFFGSYAPINGPINTTPGTDANGNPVLTATVSVTPQFSEEISVAYSNDPNYTYVSTVGDFITVNIPDFSLTPSSGISLTVTAGQSANANVTVTPLSQTASTVVFSFPGGSQTVAGYSLTVAPQSVTLSGAPVSAIVTIAPLNGASAAAIPAVRRRPGFGQLGIHKSWGSALIALTALLFVMLVININRPRRFAFALNVLCIFVAVLGCGGGGSGGNQTGGGGGGGTLPTSVTVTTSNTKLASGLAPTFTATVTSSNPVTGTVTFFFGNSPFTVPIALINGQAQFSGDTFLPGVYQITAQYSGDASHQPSTSPPLTQVLTGTIFQQLIGQTGGLTHSIPANVTIQ
jgi:Pro-kumamolisin, activation domain/Bacterial Ig-like domain (group 3)